MDREQIMEIFEAYFEKYKKTEGDRTSWSAPWTEHTPAGKFEIIMTKCPKGTTFKVFLNSRKLAEIPGWEGFFEQMPSIAEAHPGAYDPEMFFGGMRDMT